MRQLDKHTPLKGGMIDEASPAFSISRASKIKLAHVVARLSMGGLELEVIKLLNRLDQSRYQTAIIATEDIMPTARALVHDGIELVALNKAAGMQWQVVARIARFCREREIDILHSHNWATLLYGVLGGLRARVPILIHGEHGRETHEYQPSFKQRLACQWLAARCDCLTAVSDDILPLLANSWRVPAHKIVKMPIGIALHEFDFNADRRLAKRALGLPEETFVLGAIIGNFRPVKDLPTMLRAFQIVRQKFSRARLVIVGGGNLTVAQQQACECGLAHDVLFLGERHDIARVLCAFDLYLNSSLYEGMSNAILEAMAAGAAVVATNVGGTPAIVREGETGLLAPPSSPENFAATITRLLEDEALRTRLRQTARAYVEREHSHEHYVRAHEKIYEECYAVRSNASGVDLKVAS